MTDAEPKVRDPGDGAQPRRAAPEGVRFVRPPADGEHAFELAEVARAFNRGDFRAVRELSQQVSAAPDSNDEERAFARQMLFRTGVDPVALVVGGIALAILIVAAVTSLRC